MKRHLVMDLYHAKSTCVDEKDWHEIDKDLPDYLSCKVKLKLKNGNEVFAYFYADGGILKSHYFWECQSKECILNRDITHWTLAKENNNCGC